MQLKSSGELFTIYVAVKDGVTLNYSDVISSFNLVDSAKAGGKDETLSAHITNVGKTDFTIVKTPALSAAVGSATLYAGWDATKIAATANALTVKHINAEGTESDALTITTNYTITKVNGDANGTLTAGSENTIEVTGAGAYAGLTATITGVTAAENPLASVALKEGSNTPNKALNAYASGDALDIEESALKGVALTATYTDGTTVDVANGYDLYLNSTDTAEGATKYTSGTALTVSDNNINSYLYAGKTIDSVTKYVKIGQLTVSPKVVAKPTADGTYTYNGTEQTFTVGTNTDAAYYTITGDTKGTNAGTYTATASLKDKTETKWSEDGTDDVTLTWSIAKASQTGLAGTASIYRMVGGTVTLDPSSLIPDDRGDWSIGEPTVSSEGINAVVNGTENHTVTLTVGSADLTAGTSYTVTLPITSTNYKGSESETFNVVYTVTAVDKTPVPTADLSISLNDSYFYGTEITPSLTGTHLSGLTEKTDLTADNSYTVTYEYKNQDAADSTYTTTKPTDVGAYTVRATYEDNVPNGENSSIPGYAATLTKDFEIKKATNAITGVSITGWTYGEAANTPSITGATFGDDNDVTYTYYTDATCAADKKTTAENSGATDNGGVPVNAGKYWVKASIAATENYTAAAATKEFTIAKKSQTDITVDTRVSIYLKASTGTAELDPETKLPSGYGAYTIGTPVIQKGGSTSTALTATVSGESNKVKMMVGGTDLTANDEYTVKLPITSTNYKGSSGETFNVVYTLKAVAKTPATITVSASNIGYGEEFGSNITVSGANIESATEVDQLGDEADRYALTYTYEYKTTESGTYAAFSGTPTNAGYYRATVVYEDTVKNNGEATPVTDGLIPGYTATQTAEFQITPKLASSATVTLYAPGTTDTTGVGVTSFEFANAAIQPVAKVVLESATLIAGTDYEVTYANNTNVATANGETGPNVKVTFKGNYSGTVTAPFAITVKALTAGDLTIAPTGTYTYDGTAKIPTATVTVNSTVGNYGTLTAGTDYDISSTAVDASTEASATVTFKGNYSGTATFTFTISPKSIAGVTVKAASDFIYKAAVWSSDDIASKLTVTDPTITSKTLRVTTDYTIGFASGVSVQNVGSYTATLTGAGNYTGTTTASFKLAPATITAATIGLYESADSSTVKESWEYTGSAIKPVVKLSGVTGAPSGATLTQGTDYTVSYSNNTAVAGAGTGEKAPTVTVTFRGNYVNGTEVSPATAKIFKTNFSITAATLTPAVTVSGGPFTYNGAKQVPTVTVKASSDANAATLKEGTDYTVSYKKGSDAVDPTDAGDYTVVVTPAGNYTGSPDESKTFTIAPKLLTADAVTLTPDSYVYDGTAKKPTVTVKDGSKALAAGESRDYTVAYSNNTAVPTNDTSLPTVTVTLKTGGNYAASAPAAGGTAYGYELTKTFTISAATRTLTAGDLTIQKSGAATALTITDNASEASPVYTATSSNTSVATVAVESGSVKVTPVAVGTATITVSSVAVGSYGAGQATAKVTVTENAVQTVTFTLAKTSGVYGTDAQIEISGLSSSEVGDATFTFASSDESIAKVVEASGGTPAYKVEVYKAGTVTLTATAAAHESTGADDTAYDATSKSVTLTIAPKPLTGITWTDGALGYDGTAKNVTASVTSADGLVGSDELTVTVSGGTETNAGTYTAAVTALGGASASNYTLPTTGLTHSYTITKADRTLAATATSVTLTPATPTASLGLSWNDADGSGAKAIAYTLGGSAPKSIAVNLTAGTASAGKGTVSALANGTATLTINIPETANYNTATPVTLTVSSTTAPIVSIEEVEISTGTSDTYEDTTDVTATVTTSGTTGEIAVTGVAPAGKTIKVTYNKTSGTGTIEIPYGANAYPTTVDSVALDGVTYRVKVSVDTLTNQAVKDLETGETEAQVTATFTGTDEEKAEKKAEAEDAGASVAADNLVAAAGAATANSTQVNNDIESLTTTAGGAGDGKTVEATVEMSMDVNVKNYNPDGEKQEMTLDIKPQYQVKVEVKEGGVVTGSATGAKKNLPAGSIKSPVFVKIQVPVRMNRLGLFIKHMLSSGVEYLNPTFLDDETPVGAPWYMIGFWTNSFSDFTLTSVNYSATVRFIRDDSTEIPDTEFTGSTIGDELPTDSKDGYTFLGWKADGSSNTYKGTLTESMLQKMQEEAGGNTLILKAQFKQNSTPVTPTPSTTSGGGGGGAENKISTASGTKNGSLSYSNANAKKGDTVVITPKADKGYKLASVVVKDAKGNEIPVTLNADGTYSFVMPDGKVTVTPTFVEETAPAAPKFNDVPAGEYYADAVAWAMEKGITNGTSDTTFSPNKTCTRAEVVTFLWRAAGSPEPAGTGAKFTDLGSANSYYYKAVLWAVEQGVTNGTSADKFSPNETVTRGQVVTFLYRYEKASASAGSAFQDVESGAFYAPAVNWAVENKITNGTSNTTFSPANGCTRGQIVTFLYRDFVK